MCIVTLGIFLLKSSLQTLLYTSMKIFYRIYIRAYLCFISYCISTHFLSILFPLRISVFSAWFRLSHTLYLTRAYLWCLWCYPPMSTNSLCLSYRPIGFLPRLYNWSLVPSKINGGWFLGTTSNSSCVSPVPSPWPCQLSDTMLPQSKKSS